MSRRLPTLTAALLLALLATAARAAEPRVVEIVARRFKFTPAEITLRQGEPVILRLRSEDVTHGFYSKPLGLDAIIEASKVTDVPLTPAQAGTFPVICDHFCGSGHGGMKMTLKVE